MTMGVLELCFCFNQGLSLELKGDSWHFCVLVCQMASRAKGFLPLPPS